MTIVTPSLNQGRFIREAIESVRNQTYPNIEHIVIDGGSTDETHDILRSYDDLTWIAEPDRGQSHALNKGFARARGPVFAWLNSDDYYLPRAVEWGVEALREHSADFVYADVIRVDAEGRYPRSNRSRKPFDLWAELNIGCGITSPSVFFTREAFEAVGGIDEELHFAMDYDLWIRIAKQGPCVGIDAIWSVRRMHALAKTVAQAEAFWPEKRRVSRRNGGRLLPPMLINRHIRQPSSRHLVSKAVSAAYAALGKRAPLATRLAVAEHRSASSIEPSTIARYDEGT